MKFAVISDLHIGSEQFESNFEGFDGFLDLLEKGHDEIILLGDVLKTYYPPLPWGAYGEYKKFQKKYSPLTGRFFRPPYCLLSGNHDAVLYRKRGVPYETVREQDGVKILFTHGHTFEKTFTNRAYTRFAELYMWLGYRLKRLGFPGLYNSGFEYDYRLNVRDGGLKYIRGAFRLMRERGYDIVVTGHTHDEKHLVLPNGGVYLNSGDCSTRKMFVSIDTKTGDCSLNYFTGSGIITGSNAVPVRGIDLE